MKKILANTITLLAEICCLILCVLWYIFGNGSYEAVIVGTGFIVSIIVSVFFKTKKDESTKPIELTNSDNNIVIQGNNGKIQISK
ncbi:MAG: hypothetical protein LBN95_04215 [Prevotellaceae bacterium]|jgi:hypothetical protein|nr:hypothetical protein [Prevotellaceae bacterium]